ncbi:hypothetical protein [Yoonia sp. R2-816]|uniref:hypothetical protein n=1 Tax=Yoonia sp. R2-816 TaxID=3342638 RepID=UPI00372BBFBE
MIEATNSKIDYLDNIWRSQLSIYDPIIIGDPALWIPTPALEAILDGAMTGISLSGLALRTRSKVVKEHVCRALGYPVPKGFKKTQPRFPGQFFDCYVQKSNNLQVWNEELSPTRRYVIIRVDGEDQIIKVKVVTGDTLALLDTTGTLTQKYQAQLIPSDAQAELIAPLDTQRMQALVQAGANLPETASPIGQPQDQILLPIDELFEKLSKLIGARFPDIGIVQERNRGAALHRLICETLGYSDFRDDGRFPDVRHQLLEVKLQTSPTIDLGLVRPNSEEPLDVLMVGGQQIRHCDVRYALFYAQTDGTEVTLSNFYLSTGEAFFSRFPQFQGKVLNKKLQIPLPADFFED